MYKEIQNGACIEIPDNSWGFIYKCWIPPVGYGINVANGKIEKTDIIKRSEIESEQFWENEGLPEDYKDKRKAEEYIQKVRPKHIDPYLEDIRIKQWGRRLRGVWFWNKGELVYVTGMHWLYMEHWKFQGKKANFRIPDMEYFYVVQYCVEDPFCLGLNEITRRKNGKTARVGLVGYERTSRLNNHHCGIQSKTDEDAEEVFRKAIVQPWDKLPHFFRPVYDMMKGTNPSELRFFATARRGAAADEEREYVEDPLESFIDYKSSGLGGYDGPEVQTYISDESGKLKDVSIVERQNTVRYASEVEDDEGEINYKNKIHIYTTTVEEMENGGGDFHKLTKRSNPLVRDDNGRTTSGLYTYFLPAYRAVSFDKYGYSDENKARTYFENTRRNLENDPIGLSSFIRKNPFTMAEAFRVDGDTCIYNPMVLNEQRDFLSVHGSSLVVRGNYSWVNGERYTKVQWDENQNGRWLVPKNFVFKEDEINAVTKRGSMYVPMNDYRFASGVDPFDHNVTKDKRRSNGASLVKQKVNFDNQNDPFIGGYVCRYLARPSTSELFYEDMILQSHYFGCKILPETQKPKIMDYFRDKGYANFLMKLPGEQEPGIASSPLNKQSASYYVESLINNSIKNILFIDLIEEWLEFNLKDTQEFDLSMAALWTEVAANNKLYSRKPDNKIIEIGSIFKQYKTKAV